MTRFLLEGAPGATPRCRVRDRTHPARYIGRVGVLAIALGIGVAAPGVAVAEPDATSSTAESSDTQQSSTEKESAEQHPASTSEAAEATETSSTETVTATTAAANDSAPDSSTETSLDPRDGTVQASGGANTKVTTSDGTTTSTRSAVGDKKSAHDSVVQTQPTSTLSADAVSIPQSVLEPSPRVVETTALITPSSAIVIPRVDPVTAVVHRIVSLASGLAAMVGLSPTLTSAPLTPVEPPALWVMLAWVRRQFEDALLGESPSVGFGAITTSQSGSGVVTGTISATDPDKNRVALRVIAGPANGAVTVDPITGHFTYTPTEALARSGGVDTFTVAVTESTADAPRDFVAAILGVNRRDTTAATVLVSVLPVGGTEDDALDAAELVRLVADGKATISSNSDGTVRTIGGTFTDTAVRSNADAAHAMNYVAGLLGAPAGFADEMAITSQSLGLAGRTPTEVIYRLQPMVNGIPALASQVVLVTGENGTVTGVFSSYHRGITRVDTTSSTDFDDQEGAATAVLAALAKRLTEQGADAAAALAAVATMSDLVIYDVDPDVAPTLARRVTVYSTVIPTDADAVLPVVSTTYYLYANGIRAGDIFAAFSNATDASTAWVTSTKTTTDLKAKSRSITGQYQASSGSWRFNDVARNVSTYSASSTSSAPGTMVKKTWWTSWNRSAVSAHANAAVVYDYYRNTLGRMAYDGLGSSLRVSVLPNSYNNAYWDPGLKILVFGHDFEAALDVVGHEFTHGVVNYAVSGGSGLIYQNESGALNESYADILGGLIENKTGSARWLIAEDYRCGKTSCAIRDMSDPARFGQPETYANRYTGTADYGGVHTNSGIFNFAAYKMMTDSRTSTISGATWAAVFYGSLFKLSSNATMADGRAAVLNTAKDLGFTVSEQQAVTDAFNAVGIF